MLTLWHPYTDWHFGNLRRTFSTVEELRREMGELLGESSGCSAAGGNDVCGCWPKTSIRDSGEAFILRAEVPGLSERDLDVTITGDTVAISGQRKGDAQEGYSVHHRERGSYRFSRRYQLPVKVNVNEAEATVKNGVLELVLPKAPEAQPKKITVTAH